jgi:hypothetical protein
MFTINGLEIVQIRENAPKFKQYLLLPFVALPWIGTVFSSDKSRKRHRTDLTLDRRIILGGNNLIIITRKSAPSPHRVECR